jgi:hypothetical protein
LSETPNPIVKTDDKAAKEEYRRQVQQKLQNEWKDMEVKIPLNEFAITVIYQALVPYLLPIALVVAYIWTWVQLPRLTIVWILFMPGIFIGVNLAYLISLVYSTYIVMRYWDKKSPPVEGVFDRKFSGNDAADPRIQYYHRRGFIIKLPVFYAKKSIFPWTVHWVLIKLGHNKIHPDAMYLDSFSALEFTELGPGFVGGDGIVLSSHVVDSIFGKLTIQRCKCEQNAVVHTNAIMAPGSTMGPDCSIFPNSFAIKGQKAENPGEFYIGIPGKTFGYPGAAAAGEKYFHSLKK